MKRRSAHFVEASLDSGVQFFGAHRRRLCLVAALLLAALHWLMAVTAVVDKSPTFDEPAHLASGYSYWLREDFRLDSESAMLAQRWAALPLLLDRPTFVAADSLAWKNGSARRVGHDFFYALGNNSDRMLLKGRMMIALFSAGCVLLVYFWSRSLFGYAGGLLSAALAAFSPTLLATGALVTADAAAALFFGLTVWSFWRMLQRLTPASFFATAFSLSALCLTKMSAPLVLPMFALLIVVQLCSSQPSEIQIAGLTRTVPARTSRFFLFSAVMAALGAVVVLVLWASYGWRYTAFTSADFARVKLDANWSDYLKGDRFLSVARAWHLLPEAYLYGLAFIRKYSALGPSFLDGRWSVVGFRSFFPLAFFYKTTLPFLCLLTLSGVAAAWRYRRAKNSRSWEFVRRDCYRLAPAAALLFVYGASALGSRLNIGLRHILPLYPVLFVLCGACAFYFRTRVGAMIVAFLLLWHAGESLAIRPHYLAYFNEIAGGPSRGYTHLVDSSLDWGQDLPALKKWLDGRRSGLKQRAVYLAYFGSAEPAWYGIDAIRLPGDPYVDRTFPALSGGIYCVSATTLQHVYAQEMGPWCQPYEKAYQKALIEIGRYRATASNPAARARLLEGEGADYWLREIKRFEGLQFARLCARLRHQEAVAQIGYSILVYELSDDEVRSALTGPPAELLPSYGIIGAPQL